LGGILGSFCFTFGPYFAKYRRKASRPSGRVTGQPRQIEIWFSEHGGRFYLIAERESANWVRNIQSQPQVKVRVGDAEFNAFARVVRNDREPQLAATVKAFFVAKYGWSDGLIVELTPA
jgi:deazaflavin-dependent oxidoreductase (nitroreductase family)